MSVNRKRQQRIRARDKKRHARKVFNAELLKTERILGGLFDTKETEWRSLAKGVSTRKIPITAGGAGGVGTCDVVTEVRMLGGGGGGSGRVPSGGGGGSGTFGQWLK